jgi:hypothetical protein
MEKQIIASTEEGTCIPIKHVILFYDYKGPILSHAVPAGQTVNAAYYATVP